MDDILLFAQTYLVLLTNPVTRRLLVPSTTPSEDLPVQSKTPSEDLPKPSWRARWRRRRQQKQQQQYLVRDEFYRWLAAEQSLCYQWLHGVRTRRQEWDADRRAASAKAGVFYLPRDGTPQYQARRARYNQWISGVIKSGTEWLSCVRKDHDVNMKTKRDRFSRRLLQQPPHADPTWLLRQQDMAEEMLSRFDREANQCLLQLQDDLQYLLPWLDHSAEPSRPERDCKANDGTAEQERQK